MNHAEMTALFRQEPTYEPHREWLPVEGRVWVLPKNQRLANPKPHHWPPMRVVKATATQLMCAVWSDYPMLVFRRSDMKVIPPCERVIDALPWYMEEE